MAVKIQKLIALAGQLLRLEPRLQPGQLAELSALAHGRTLAELVQALRNAADPSSIQAAAEMLAANESGCACSGEIPPEPTQAQFDEAAKRLVGEAFSPFTRNLELVAKLNSLGVEIGWAKSLRTSEACTKEACRLPPACELPNRQA